MNPTYKSEDDHMEGNRAATRAEVYRVLDGEREYQNGKWGSLDTGNTVGDFLVYMRVTLDKAFEAHAGTPTPGVESLEVIRKLTALGIACMEWHGAPERK